ncbi:hypothetical protein PHLCEN_2v284 [Hermanssonia centrifuga]|uniref:Uncharacterized protein n=1 Tax=Hermanssonia centrifuga TaxID=98765 RepID=A0A2R6S6C8_9APHY|nr:hypothetical protein PHLCEN_2v284 [Hermanssonia centrifuga]
MSKYSYEDPSCVPRFSLSTPPALTLQQSYICLFGIRLISVQILSQQFRMDWYALPWFRDT